MTKPLAYWNGNYLPQSQVRLALNDAGFVFGATVTDMVRTFRHQLFRLDAHLLRFRQSCQLAHIPQPLDDDQLAVIAQELVRHNATLIPAEHDLALVMLATPGEIGYYLGQPGGPGDGPPTLCMHTFSLPFQRYVRLFREGARLVTPKLHSPASRIPPSIKHRSRLHWWLAEAEAHEADPAANMLLVNADGLVMETATANFLAVSEGILFSPKRQHILGGISLLVVEELCEQLGLGFCELDLKVSDCLRAEEALLTSTPYCMAPVSCINGRAMPFPGPVFQQLIAAWNRKVGLDVVGQILQCGNR